MKRDWDVVRAILISLEELGDTQSKLLPDQVKGYDAENVCYHMRIMKEAGLIEAIIIPSHGPVFDCEGRQLTWKGHEFLDKMRDDKIWNRIKRTVKDRGLELSFITITTIGETLIKKMLGGDAS